MRNWRARRSERSTCVTAEWSTDDRPAGAAESHLSAVAVGADVFRLWCRSGSDDRAAVDRRSDADAGAPGEACRWWNYHGFTGRPGRRGDEDWRHRRPVLLDRPRIVPVSA